MAKLYLKYEQAVLKEISLAQGTVTIGRLPDNLIQVDNLAVSGHHAKIYWDTDHYVLEDNNSLNGTFVNERRVSKAILKDGDQILVGKHTVSFKDEWHEDNPGDRTQGEATMPALPAMEATMVMTGKKAAQMLSNTAPSAAAMAGQAAGAAPAGTTPAAPGRERIATLTVVDGKSAEPQYVLTSKLTVIGKSEMATIKLQGWFAPKVAAIISKRENKYFIAQQDKAAKVKVNGSEVAGQKELGDGDSVELAGLKMNFTFND